MGKNKTYVIGSGKPPRWCASKLMQYRKIDGSIGCEYLGRVKTFDLDAGDILEFDGIGRINVCRKGEKVVDNRRG